MSVRILAFAGSTRQGSLNRMALRAAGAALRDEGAEVTEVDLAEYDLPIFNQDLEQRSFPEEATQLQDLMDEHDGVLVASPEYNASITPLLKNVIDWTSRGTDDRGYLQCYRGKVFALISASPGRLGGMRSVRVLRDLLADIGAVVIPRTLSIPRASDALDEDGSLREDRLKESMRKLARDLVTTAAKLKH